MSVLSVSAQPKAENNLRVVVESLGTETLDPTQGPFTTTKLYLPLLYDSLIGADKTNSELSKETGVAKDWKASSDGRKYTFYLRQTIKFHNGDELTAEDVKFTFERAIGPKGISSLAGVLKKVIGEIIVDDRYTVTFVLREPKFSFLLDISSLVGSESMIVPKGYIEKVGEEKFALEPIGSGPYRFKRRISGSSVEFEAVPNHWSIGVPKFANVSVEAVAEQGTRLTMLRSGQADVISVGRRYVDDLQREGFLIVTKPASNQIMMVINNQWETDSPLHDQRVRRAMGLAIDSRAILKALLRNAGELTRCWVADVAYATRPQGLCDPQEYDPAKAKQLLVEAGYASGFDLTFRSYPTPGVPEKLDIDQAIANYFRAVGIRAKIEAGEFGAYRAQWASPAGLPRTIANNPTVSQVVIGSLIHLFWGKDSPLSVTRGVNPKTDAAVERMLQAPDLTTYKQRLMEAWGALLEDSNVIMLFSIDSKYAANKTKIAKEWEMGTSTADPALRALVTK